jgi:hypothetical protein
MVSTIVSSSRRRSSMARLAAVSCADELSASCRLASKIGRHVVEGAHQVAHLAGGDAAPRDGRTCRPRSRPWRRPAPPPGRVICLERNSASQTLEKKTKP